LVEKKHCFPSLVEKNKKTLLKTISKHAKLNFEHIIITVAQVANVNDEIHQNTSGS
jgi:hypothetical protein